MAEITLTKENFDEQVINAKEPILVDFWASWCGPCKQLSPVIEKLADGSHGFRVGKVNVDEQEELATQFGIMSIPTVIYFRDGKAQKKSVGFVTEQELLSLTK